MSKRYGDGPDGPDGRHHDESYQDHRFLDYEAAVDDPGDTPVDLTAVQADDALLDLIGRDDLVDPGLLPGPGFAGTGAGTDTGFDGEPDSELARVLVAWRREVESEPVGQLVDTDRALTVLNSARRRRQPRRHPLLAPLAAAAAVLVIAFSAVGLVAKSAKPGDQLFALTEVLYSDYARSMKAAYEVRNELEHARSALAQGRTEEAKQSLERAQEQLRVISPDTNERTELVDTYQELSVILGERESPGDAGETPPPASPAPEASPTGEPVNPAPVESPSADPRATEPTGEPPTEATPTTPPTDTTTATPRTTPTATTGPGETSAPPEPTPRSAAPSESPPEAPPAGDGNAETSPPPQAPQEP